MKKALVLAAALAVVFQIPAFAGSMEGTVKEVKAEEMALVLAAYSGDQTVTYSAETTWDEGVTDPSALVGKKVTVTTNDETQAVESVMAVVE